MSITTSLNNIVEPATFSPTVWQSTTIIRPEGIAPVRLGRSWAESVRPDAIPSVVCLGEPIKVCGVLPTDVILEDLGNNLYLIAKDSYAVFQCRPDGTHRQEGSKRKTTEGPCFARRAKQGRSHRAKRRTPTGVFLSVPRNLVIPESHKDVENEIFYYCHTILQGTYCRKHDLDGSTRINRELMRQILGSPALETKAQEMVAGQTDHLHRPRIFPG